jgi:hypothetical protein
MRESDAFNGFVTLAGSGNPRLRASTPLISQLGHAAQNKVAVEFCENE